MPGNLLAEQSRAEMRGDRNAGNKGGISSINKHPSESRRQLLHDWTTGLPFLYGMKITRYEALSQKEGRDDGNNTDQNVLDWGDWILYTCTRLLEKTDSFSLPRSSSSGINNWQGVQRK
jgi:hypothetical protein